MNMKKRGYHLFILCFSFFFSSKIISQAYFPILNNYSEWHVTTCFSGCLTDKYYSIGDTVINGLHYSFLDRYHYNKNFVIREDTTERKVYMRLLAEPSTTKEYLLYDFSLQVNDTMFIHNPGSPFPKYAGNFIVDSIKLKPLVNSTRKFFYLHSTDTIVSVTKNTVWVEGIGSLCLINTPGAPPQINGAGQLSCYFHNGINEYQNLDSISNCIAIYPLGIEEQTHLQEIRVYQNFGTETIFISSSLKNDGLKISLYNLEGQLILSKEELADSLISIHTNNISKGLVLLKVEHQNGSYKTYKLLIP